MKIAVFSDTHGNTGKMLRTLEALRPDAIVHLGDYERDTDGLKKAFPDIPLYQVCGNCDVNSAGPIDAVVSFGPVRALLTHGHRYCVDWGRLDSLVYARRSGNAPLRSSAIPICRSIPRSAASRSSTPARPERGES